jgi:hypothetical protein
VNCVSYQLQRAVSRTSATAAGGQPFALSVGNARATTATAAKPQVGGDAVLGALPQQAVLFQGPVNCVSYQLQ